MGDPDGWGGSHGAEQLARMRRLGQCKSGVGGLDAMTRMGLYCMAPGAAGGAEPADAVGK